MLGDPRVRTIPYARAPFNFSWVCNLGAAQSRGPLLCFLNDDVEVTNADWLEQLVARVSLDGVGAAGPMLYYPSGTIQHAGVLLGLGGLADHTFRNLKRGQPGYFARAAVGAGRLMPDGGVPVGAPRSVRSGRRLSTTRCRACSTTSISASSCGAPARA